jgi:periplasmic divalent cation tolerance protein
MLAVILITCANKKEARKIARELIRAKLAACVNIVDKVESIFCWQGRVERAREVLLVVKSSKSKLSALIKAVRKIHSYQVPEIIALPIIAGYRPYLEWIDESLG